MKVKELIYELKRIKNKNLEIFVFNDGNISPILMVDDGMDDRVDLNIIE